MATMLRQLLTLLAVLTGLTTAVAPAQAHALDAGVRAVAAAQHSTAVPTPAEQLARQEAEALLRSVVPLIAPEPQAILALPVAAVVLKADRAHE